MDTKKFNTKSVMLSRKPRADENDEFKTALIALYTENNPHKSGVVPTEVLEYPNIEKIRIRDLNVSYYLEGNDTIINDLKTVTIEIDEKKRKIVLRAEQDKVEQR
ncbi:MAG: hypothetical protein KKE20_05985 [Nanoarchaeota archaeon]|nr:hypothetical protein [Nanoarchaeota archaeon]